MSPKASSPGSCVGMLSATLRPHPSQRLRQSGQGFSGCRHHGPEPCIAPPYEGGVRGGRSSSCAPMVPRRLSRSHAPRVGTAFRSVEITKPAISLGSSVGKTRPTKSEQRRGCTAQWGERTLSYDIRERIPGSPFARGRTMASESGLTRPRTLSATQVARKPVACSANGSRSLR